MEKQLAFNFLTLSCNQGRI